MQDAIVEETGKRVVPEGRADLGLLFVHGIGTQREGESLLAGGEAIFSWASDWVELTENPRVERAVVRPSQCAGAERAQAEFSLHFGDSSSQRVVMAESLWADQFDPPPYRDLCGWLLTYGSWIAFRQLTHAPLSWLVRACRWLKWDSAPIEMMGSWFFGFFALIPVFFLQLFLVALYLLSLVPILALTQWITRMTVAISSIIGDSYIFVSSPIARVAIAGKILSDLRWLERRCESVVVVAHSQGAAVAFDALRFREEGKPARLITYGAGIRKLVEIDSVHRREAAAPRWIGGVWILALVAGLALWIVIQDWLHLSRLTPAEMAAAYNPNSHFAILFLFVAYFVFILMTSSAGADHEREIDEELEKAMSDFLKRGAFWADLHASKDPVPGGPLLQGASEWQERDSWEARKTLPENFRSAGVTNHMSTLKDHTSYWESRDDFVVRVVDCLDRWTQTNWLARRKESGSEPAERVSAAWGRIRKLRWWRVFARRVLHGALGLGAIALAFRTRQEWPFVLADLENLSSANPWQSWMVGMRMVPDWVVMPFLHLFAVGLFLKFVAAPLWNRWDRMFRRGRFLPKDAWRGGRMLLCWLLGILLPLTATIGAARARDYSVLWQSPRDLVVGSVRFANSGWGALLLVLIGAIGLVIATWIMHRGLVALCLPGRKRTRE